MVAGGGGHGVQSQSLPLPVLRSPTSRTFVPLCFPTPTLHCVALVFRFIKVNLSKIKNCVEKWTTLHSLARSLKWHSFEPSLYLEAKSAVIWDEQSCRPSSQEGLPWTDFSLPQRKIPRPTNLVFDDIWPEWPWIASFASLPDTEV